MNNQGALPNFLRHISRHFVPNIGTIIIVAALLFANNVRAAGLTAGASLSAISYQGTLSSVSGTPIDATVGMTFRFYNVQSGGTALWTESHTGANAVPISNGLFNVALGSITPIPSTVWNYSTVYLGVQVQGDSTELSPREVIGSVPSAARADIALSVPDGSIGTNQLADGAATGFWSVTGSTDATITSTTPTLLPQMSLNIQTTGEPVEILFNTGCGVSGNGYVSFAIWIDGTQVTKHALRSFVNEESTDTTLLWVANNLSAGSHTIEIYWWTSLPSISANVRSATNLWEERVLTVHEFRR
jgi:hypothetical protein